MLLTMLMAGALMSTGGTRFDTCPSAYESSELRIHSFLTNPLMPLMQERSPFDLGSASADDIRLLTDGLDRQTCEALWQSVRDSGTDLEPSDQLALYRSGDRFFVPINRSRRDARPGVLRFDGNSTVDLYDSEFRLIRRFRI